eukprot:c7673_g1_i1.p1 GENE.c7673_g1_i1~~c7673_g1_i1.p1  ORF type:complete len:355 (-),score=62.31 c7673_g1_i1:124-1158(-)
MTSTIPAQEGKPRTSMQELSGDGAFKRIASGYRDWIKADGSTQFPPEADRYHLYVSYACPWASRALFVRAVKGLENVIGLTIVHPVFEKTSSDPEDKHNGWVFKVDPDFPECTTDPIRGCKTLRELYVKNDDTFGKYTVPILFDKKTNKIVNNESADIIRMFSDEFDAFSSRPGWTLYPTGLQKEIDEVNEWVYPMINNGVYRAGFAQKQEPYNLGVADVFAGLDRAEEILSRQRYIASATELTEADVRLFVTIVRFDEVYHGHFKCNKKRLSDYHHLSNYVRDLYQIPKVAESVNMPHIKHHYHRSHPTINVFGIVPVGPHDNLHAPHDRHLLGPACSHLHAN